MKPPARRRRKRNRILEDESVYVPRLRAAAWQAPELLRLLAALRKLRGKGGGKEEIDYASLKSAVPARSISEIQSLVESLRDEVITRASMELKRRRWSENRIRRPIQLWTEMASEVTGSLEEPISIAFSQMLRVSSIEPCTVNYSNVKDETISPSIHVRPTPPSPIQVLGKRPSSNTALRVVQTPAASNSKVVKLLNGKTLPTQQQPSTTAGTSHAATSQSAASLNPGPTTISTTSSSSSRPATQSTCASSSTPVLSTTPSSIASSPAASTHITLPLSTPTAATQARFGSISNSVARDSPDMLGDKYVVNFEKIYRYLSVIHKPDEKCQLTAMESAIVLDLLMSLPEELPLLNCNKLHKHLLEVYQCLSSPAESKTASEMCKKLKDESRNQTEAATDQTSNTTNGLKNSTGSWAPTTEDTSSGGKEHLPEEAKRKLLENNNNNTTTNQSGDLMDLHLPLNPFMIPMKMLMRRQVRVPNV